MVFCWRTTHAGSAIKLLITTDCMQDTHLLREPFVQLLAAVQHQTFSLRSFLTLCHQCGVLISLKQSWDLPTHTSTLKICYSLSHIRVFSNNDGNAKENVT